MARTTIADVSLAGSVTPAFTNLSTPEKFTQGDDVNEMDAPFTAGMRVLIHNRGVGAQLATLVSKADSLGRVQNDDITLGAGELALAGPFQEEGWRQDDGALHIDVDSTDIWLAVLR